MAVNSHGPYIEEKAVIAKLKYVISLNLLEVNGEKTFHQILFLEMSSLV